ncbi:MAG: PQQ-binding-like beta-propeller repeat protein [Chloroflexota bacterium]|nr:PQQ-binding-like beta-propeller repeat protein [Chloroflexota bacterium]
MKQPKILLLVVIALLPLTLVSCAPWGTQSAGGWSGTVFEDGIIYAGTKDGRVVAINSSTENPEWSYSTPVTSSSSGLSCGQTLVPTAIYGTPVVDRDIVYIGTYSGQVLALNMMARSQNLTFPQQRYGEWEWGCPIDNAKSNAIIADLLVSTDVIYVSSSNGRVYSLDKEFGDLNWESEILDERHRKLWTSPVIQGNTVYVSTFDGHIYALLAETGELLSWSFESEAGFASSPVIYEDTLFFGSFDRYLYAVKIGSDVPMWEFPQEKPAGNWFWASPIVNEGIVYAGCLDGRVYAIEAKTGEKLWEFDAGDTIVSSPVLMDNLLIVIDESGTVYVFDLGTELLDKAVPLKTISIGAAVRSSFCAQEGLVYIRGEDNWIYAVDIDKGGLGWKVSLTIEE